MQVTLPKISVITPTYNASSLIEACVLSVAGQSYRNIEHLVIDACSTDGTQELLAGLATQHPHLLWISEPDDGIYDAINKGISLAKGEWIYILGSDDTLYSDTTFENIVSRLLLDDCEIVYGNVLWGKGTKIYDGLFTYEKLLSKNICRQGIFYKKNIFNKLGLFDTSYQVLADWVYNIKWFCDPDINHAYTEEIIAIYNPDSFSAVTTNQDFANNRNSILEQYFLKEFTKIFILEKEVTILKQSSKLNADEAISLDATVEHLYTSIEKLQSENAELNQELNKIKKSEIWKVIKPLRKLSRSIRKRLKWIKSRLNTFTKKNKDADVKQALSCNITEYFNSNFTLNHRLSGNNEQGNTPVDIYIILGSSLSDTQLLCSSIAQNTTEPCNITFFIKDSFIASTMNDLLEKFNINGTIINISGNNQTTLIHDKLLNSKNHFIIAEGITSVPMGWTKKLLTLLREDNKIVSTTPSFRYESFFNSVVADVEKEFGVNASKESIDEFLYSFDAREDDRLYLPNTSWCYGLNRDRYKESGQLQENTTSIREHIVCFIEKQVRIAKSKSLIIGSCFTSTSDRAASTKSAMHNGHYFSGIISRNEGKSDDRVLRALFLLFLCTNNASGTTQTLFIDHELGGGANLYRDKFIDEKIKCGDTILLYTYSYYNKTYNLTCILPSRKVSFQSKKLEHITQLIIKFTKVNNIIFSESVSFPRIYSLLSEILSIKNILNIRLTALIHDYFYICPSFTLLNNKSEFCNIPENISICQNCMADHHGDFTLFYKYADIVSWRKKWCYFLLHCDAIICFSNSSMELLLKTYTNIPRDKVTVIPHNVEHLKTRQAYSVKTPCDKNSITIGVLGEISMHKGSRVINEMLQIIHDEHRSVKIVVVGEINQETDHPKLTVTGKYRHSELLDIIHSHSIDIFLMPSIWPETFSYTTHEIIEMGYPLAAFKIGAQGDVVAKYEKGLILNDINARFALDEIENYLANVAR
jgi:glycosyltransferase involved in cell wall biosynthesis